MPYLHQVKQKAKALQHNIQLLCLRTIQNILMSTNPLEDIENNIMPETKSYHSIVPTTETVEDISMVLTKINIAVMVKKIKAKIYD